MLYYIYMENTEKVKGMKGKRVCSVLAGIINIVKALLMLVVIVVDVLGGGANCLGFVAGGGVTGNEGIGAIGMLLAGPFMILFILIAVVVLGVPLVVMLCGAVTLFRANGKKTRSTVPVVLSIIADSLVALIFAANAVKMFSGDATDAITMIATLALAAICIVNIPLCAVSLSMIKAQNKIISDKKKAERAAQAAAAQAATGAQNAPAPAAQPVAPAPKPKPAPPAVPEIPKGPTPVARYPRPSDADKD